MSYDDVFEALADEQRRQLLLGLAHRELFLVAPLSGVSRELADADETLLREHLRSSRELPSADEALVRMHCVHLPKLATYGFVEWERTDNLVAKGERFDELVPILELLDEQRTERPASDSVASLR
ncbi:DUF7344 domain-containing protein [Halosimplex amylolyticum]|uniref:DUF7344 domain-containing protein n=1 Tax=Halosimplex amylolyticum TaxID=3396616 RepID=UPI003F555468